MTRINLSAGTYQARGVAAGAQRCLNLYPEPIPVSDGEPAQWAHYPTPGLVQTGLAPGIGPGRALYQTSQGDLIAVIGRNVVCLDKGRVRCQIGSVSPGASPVRISDNGTTLFLVDGTRFGGWYCSMPGEIGGQYGQLYQIKDPAFYGSATIALLDTFFLFVNPGTSNWYVSPSQFSDEATTPFDSLYVASDETSLGTITAVEVLGQNIWLFNRFQVEFWYTSGASDFPFQRVQGVTIETGCVSPYSIAKVPTTQSTPSGGIIWLGQDRGGQPRVYLGQENSAVPISTFSVDGELQKMPGLDQAVASVYQQDGHVFYVLTIPGQSSTWVYDVSTGLWHERCGLDDSGNEAQLRPLFWCTAYGKTWACDRESGAIYLVSLDALDDAGTPIKRQRCFPHLLTNGTRAVHRKFMIDMQNGNEISVQVDWSDDRGSTYGVPQTLSSGGGGDAWPTIWRVGIARDRVYRVTWIEAAQTMLMGAFIDIEPVRS